MINGNNMYIQTAGMNVRKDNDDWRKAVDTVEVSNTYTTQDEGKVVSDGVLVAQTAMPEEVTENGTINTTLYNSVTVNVSGGGAGGSDVIFYDYDGSVVASYSAADFAQLTELPANPTHTGLTAQGWNWSLSDAKSYVANYGKLNVGQMYITSDGKTRLYITLTEGRISPYLKLYLDDNTELDIDWGDDSAHSTFATTTAGYKTERHYYPSDGDYVIAITVVEGSFVLQSSVNYRSSILWNGYNSDTSPDIAYNNSIKKVEIGNNITNIGQYAFSNCTSLQAISMPNTLTRINKYAFYKCYSLLSISIPSSVTWIDVYVFGYGYALASAALPNSLTYIGTQSFFKCWSLVSITLPTTISYISTYLFSNCYSLRSVVLPDTLTSIGQYAFYDCFSLQSIVVPEGVTEIGISSFSECAALKSVTLPSTLTSINSSFGKCESLATITIPEGVTTIGNATFSDCIALTSIVLPDTVTSLGPKVFQACYSLASVTLSSRLTSIGNEAFSACSYLDCIRFESTTPPTAGTNVWMSIPFSIKLLIPLGTYGAYTSAANYPSASYKRIVYSTYASGETLPTTSTDGYTLTWYATMNDAASQTNPITVGNGNEVYARCS